MSSATNQPQKLLDIGQMMLAGELPPLPISALLGFRLTSLEPGQAVFSQKDSSIITLK